MGVSVCDDLIDILHAADIDIYILSYYISADTTVHMCMCECVQVCVYVYACSVRICVVCVNM